MTEIKAMHNAGIAIPGLKVGWVTRPDSLGHFLLCQVAMPHPQTKLSGCHVFFRKQCWHLVAKWVNFGSDECTEISLLWNHLIISSCFEACGVQRFHLQEVCARDRFCSYPAKNEGLFHINNFSCHVSYITFEKKTSTCGSQVGRMWVTSGLFCESDGSTGVNQFQPWWVPCSTHQNIWLS